MRICLDRLPWSRFLVRSHNTTKSSLTSAFCIHSNSAVNSFLCKQHALSHAEQSQFSTRAKTTQIQLGKWCLAKQKGTMKFIRTQHK